MEIDQIMTVYLNDGTEAGFKNHDSEVREGVLVLTSEDGLEKTIFPLTSVHHTFSGLA